MNLLIVFSLMVLPLLNVVAQTGTAAAADTSQASGTTQILVQFKASATATQVSQALQSTGATDKRDLSQIHVHVLSVPSTAAAGVVKALSALPSVQHAAQAISMTKASTPNDPGYSQQWALPQISWDRAYGSVNPAGKATIAVLDTGVDATHPDLSGVVNTSAGVSEIGGDPNTDPNGHGTEMAGIAAASAGNSTGMAGVDYAGASLVSYQVLGSDGTGTDAAVTQGVYDAANAGANVILMGLSSQTYSSALAAAVSYAQSKGAVVVAATGNDGSTDVSYPAGLPGVIGVASTDQNDNVTPYSNTGSAAVAAPGEGIYATEPGNNYGNVSGTSPASAEVAGLAGLLIANGDDASQAYNQIVGAADPLSGQSFGRIDVTRALGAAVAPVATATPAPTPTSGTAPVYTSANTNNSRITFPANNVTYNQTGFDSGCASTAQDVCGLSMFASLSGQQVQVSVQRASDGDYWDGSSSSWVPAPTNGDAIYNTATLGAGVNNWTKWSYIIASPLSNDTYTVQAQSGSGGTVDKSVASKTFTISSSVAGTLVTVPSVTGPYGGTVTLSATLTDASSGNALSGQTVTFYLNGTNTSTGITTVGTATTGTNGVATITANLAGLFNAGTYSNAIEADFGGGTVGTTVYSASSGYGTLTVTNTTPTITWANPADITYGTPLSSTQLDATANVPGTFVYTPAAGTVLSTGSGQTLSVTFTPSDTANYALASDSVTINVLQAPVSFTLSNLSQTYDGTAKSVTVTPNPTGVSYSVTYSQNGNPVTNPTNAGSYGVTVTSNDPNYKGSQTGTLVINQATPVLTWANPAGITYGTVLSSTQLDATANVPGTFVYTPDTGTVLSAGTHTLSVSFTPTDTTDYTTATVSVTINVLQAGVTFTLGDLTQTYDGTPKSVTVLPSPTGVSYSVTYQGTNGTTYATSSTAPTNAGSYTVTVTSTNPNYTGSQTDTLVINKATPTLTWANPAPITYGTALDATQLDATANVPGTFTYTPAAGTVLNAGSAQTLSVSFTPTDTGNYSTATASVTITVNKADQTISFGPLANKTYGDAPFTLSATASSDLTVSFSSSTTSVCTVSGSTVTILSAGTCTINADQAGTSNYNRAPTVSQSFTVARATPVLSWSTPAAITYGTALSSTQLNATASFNGNPLAGTFSYTPVAGTVLSAGTNQPLSATFTPTDTTDFNTGTVTTTITVNRAPLTITAPSASVQYSDPLPDLTKVTYNGFVNGDTANSLGGTLSCPSPVTTYGSNQVGSAPKTYTVTCSGLTSSNYAITWNTGTLTVTQEDAGVTFTGQEYASTGSSTATTATVTLRATVQDATALSTTDPRYDPYAGNITNATVTFVDRSTGSPVSSACTNIPVALLSSTDPKTGTASCTWSASSGTLSTQYEIGMVVGNYYTRNSTSDDVVVTVSQLVTGMLTGGGYLVNQASAGKLAGDRGLNTNFGFNAKTTKNGVYQGNVNIIVRSGGHVYQIKSNSITSIGSSIPSSGTCSGTAACIGTFTGGANVQDITNPSKPVSIMGGGTIQVNLHDYGEPGSSDTVGVTVYDNTGALYYSSNWTGAKTAEQVLNGGNLVVH